MRTEEPILLVDDYCDALEMYAEFLHISGYTTVLARSGQEAIALALAHRPALILMDIEMPGMNGIQAMHILRDDEAFIGTPIVALTAHAMPNERAAAMREGFDGVIAKPCLPVDLVAEIERLLNAERQV